MSEQIRYRKPNMNNLPPELGRAIFKQILSTPPVDYKRMKEEADQLEKQMKEKSRKNGNAK